MIVPGSMIISHMRFHPVYDLGEEYPVFLDWYVPNDEPILVIGNMYRAYHPHNDTSAHHWHYIVCSRGSGWISESVNLKMVEL